MSKGITEFTCENDHSMTCDFSNPGQSPCRIRLKYTISSCTVFIWSSESDFSLFIISFGATRKPEMGSQCLIHNWTNRINVEFALAGNIWSLRTLLGLNYFAMFLSLLLHKVVRWNPIIQWFCSPVEIFNMVVMTETTLVVSLQSLFLTSTNA